MRVAEHDGVDVRRPKRRLTPVPQSQFLQALKQAAIQQHLPTSRSDQVFRAGYRASSAEKLQRWLSVIVVLRHGRSSNAIPGLGGCVTAPDSEK